MRQHLMIATIVAFGFSGCTSSMNYLTDPTQSTQETQVTQVTRTQQYYEEPNSEKKEAYENTMRKIASGIKNDSNYQRIVLDTPAKKEWFKNLTYGLWDRQITRQQFMTKGLTQYPTHNYEFDFIVKGFTFN